MEDRELAWSRVDIGAAGDDGGASAAPGAGAAGDAAGPGPRADAGDGAARGTSSRAGHGDAARIVVIPRGDSEARSRDEAVRPSRFTARWRIVLWFLVLLGVVLGAVILMARSVLMSEVGDSANQEIEQEIGEFRRYAAEGRDPVTAEPFEDAARLFEVYLSRQLPADDQVILGVVGDQVLQIDRGADINAMHPSGEVLAPILADPAPSGILDDVPGGPVHWGRVALTDAPESDHLVVAVFTGGARGQVDHQMRIIAAVGGGGMLLALLISWLVAGQILRPIREVRQVAEQIQETDLTKRVPVHGDDDVADLSRTVNSMLDRVEAAYAGQRLFVDNAGHELRTPITVIRGQLELFDGADEEQRAVSRQLITTELDRMSRMVTELLTLAKADRDDFVRREPADVADMTLEIEQKAQSLGDRDWLVADVADDVAVVDPQRIVQAMLQFASNAVDHTAEGSRILIGSSVTGHGGDRRLRMWVTDDGPGIDPDEATTIFGRFARGAEGSDRNKGGAGLGLSIVRAITDAHGGHAWVRSAPGRGATFGIDVPAGRAPAGSGAGGEADADFALPDDGPDAAGPADSAGVPGAPADAATGRLPRAESAFPRHDGGNGGADAAGHAGAADAADEADLADGADAADAADAADRSAGSADAATAGAGRAGADDDWALPAPDLTGGRGKDGDDR
ncbi:ATP-binding protein [Corynebacterium sp. 335C]